MAHGPRDIGEPIYWAVVRLIHRGGMPAVTVRAAAAEAGCSVGYMRHYYDNKSAMLACSYALVTDTQMRPIEALLFSRRQPILNPTPPAKLTSEQAADVLVTYLGLDEGSSTLVDVQLSFLAMGQHDGPIGDEVGSHLVRLREVCAVVLEEMGVGRADLKIEAEGLRALIVGLLVLVPGLATVDPDDPERRQACIQPDGVRVMMRRHLDAVKGRTGAAG